jgi:predicted ATP-grasp superfamily ATP-dependent carboligase
LRLFIYEYTCATAPGTSPAAGALQGEGWAMLAAAVADFARLPGVEVVTLFHPRHAPPTVGFSWPFVAAADEKPAFRELARAADWTLVIAPEWGDFLLTRCRWVEEAGGRLLGSDLAAVRLTGDKLALGQHFQRLGIPSPECRLVGPEQACPPWPFPLVWKPRHGAGSVATFLVRNLAEWGRCAEQAAQEGWHGEAVVQPFVVGQPASVAWLVGRGQAVPLLPATQELSPDGRFHYRGGRLPLPAPLAERAVRQSRQAVEAVLGLRGYVGVDLVLGDVDWVLEINPRLTTSYVGLRAQAQGNLAEAMLRAATGEEIPRPVWRPGSFHFSVSPDYHVPLDDRG